MEEKRKEEKEMKRLKVLEYNNTTNFHKCLVEGEPLYRWFDVMVDGGFIGMEPEDLIGKTLEYETEYPYASIANNVKDVTV